MTRNLGEFAFQKLAVNWRVQLSFKSLLKSSTIINLKYNKYFHYFVDV